MGALQKEKKNDLYAYQICSEAWSASPQHSGRGTFHVAIFLISQFMPHVFPSHCHISFHFIYVREYSSVLAAYFP